MRLKNLFTVPTGQKVTEKALRRVLISSVCSILLCMTCLVSTTWAWFTVSIENTGNVIEIATITAKVTIKKGEYEITKNDNGNYSLLDGDNYDIAIGLERDAAGTNELNDQNKPPVYVLMSVAYDHSDETQETQHYYFTFGSSEDETKEVSFVGGPATVSFSVTWVKPDGAEPIDVSTVMIGEIPSEPTTDPSAGTDTSEPDATESSSDPSTESTTESTAESSTESTDAEAT